MTQAVGMTDVPEELDELEEEAQAADAGDPEESLESPGYQAPDGFEKISEDVQAYYDPINTGPMQWIPRSVRLLDNTQSKEKSSALVIGELKVACMLLDSVRDTDEDGTRLKAKLRKYEAGTSVGVWAKAGMKDLKKFGGAHVWMAPAGKRKVKNREKPMALFDIRRMKGGDKGQLLELLEDARETSIAEPAQVEYPPWWLDVLPDGGLEAAQQALEDQAAAMKEKLQRRQGRGQA